ESMAAEIAPFGLGVTILLTGMFATDIITDEGIADHRDLGGDYGAQHAMIDRRVRSARPMAAPPQRFAAILARALADRAPLTRPAVGRDARMVVVADRVLPAAGMYQLGRLAMGQPRHGSQRPDQLSLTAKQKAIMLVLRILPAPVLAGMTRLATRIS